MDFKLDPNLLLKDDQTNFGRETDISGFEQPFLPFLQYWMNSLTVYNFELYLGKWVD
ncbi:MAG: hypothetical protein IPM48_01320 [Saprospiraceae bacterium]|nr:hypothetical protein [Saprospiraceae bacterium]